MNDDRKTLLPYYRGLFCFRLLGGLMTLPALIATLIPFAVGDWYNVAQNLVSLGVAVWLFLLSGRWRLAGMAKILSLLCSGISLVFFRLLYAYGLQPDVAAYGMALNVLRYTAMVLSLIGLFLEYTAHAALIPEDRKKWYIFLVCSMAVSALSLLSLPLLQPIVGGLGIGFMSAWNFASRAVLLAADVVYLVLLQRAIRTLEKE